MEGIRELFEGLEDPRGRNRRHDLVELLVVSFAALLCGAESCVDIAEFGRAKEPLLRRFLALPHGPPSHDTVSRVFRLLDPDALEQAFACFMAAFAAGLGGGAGRVVAIDGKSLSAACHAGARATPLHLVSAWAEPHGLVLAQRRADGRREAAAALELVAMLDLDGATLTADALHGTRAMAAAVRGRKGDYALALKGNRGPLFHEAGALAAGAAGPHAATAGRAHGRREERRATVTPVPADWAKRHGFPGLAAIARVEAARFPDGATPQHAVRLYALSRVLEPAEALAVTRAHWGIENTQHWVLDVTFAEDLQRSRAGHAGENLALLRRLALNLLRRDTYDASVRRKIKRAGWNDDYLLSLLGQMR